MCIRDRNEEGCSPSEETSSLLDDDVQMQFAEACREEDIPLPFVSSSKRSGNDLKATRTTTATRIAPAGAEEAPLQERSTTAGGKAEEISPLFASSRLRHDATTTTRTTPATRTAPTGAEEAPQQERSTTVGGRGMPSPFSQVTPLPPAPGDASTRTTRPPKGEAREVRSQVPPRVPFFPDGAASSSIPQEVPAAIQPAVQHVAVETEFIDPAELFLATVFRFWDRIGRSLYTEEEESPATSFERFVEDPPMVQQALEAWLLEEGWLLKQAAYKASETEAMLALWFHDLEERSSHEESQFFTQWQAYTSRTRLLLSLIHISEPTRPY